MHITELRIRHFRNFVKEKFCFRKGVNTLIGENGSGKTNALHALRLLLDESLERNAVYLRDTDFCRELSQWRGQWIVIAVDFAELDPSEGCQLLRHTTAHMDGSQTGTCTLFFRPKLEVRKKLFELCSESEDTQAYLMSLTVDDYEPILTGRGKGDFLDDAVYRTYVGDAKTGSFPNPDDDDLEVLGVKITPIYQEVACTFVKALRDVVSELRGYRGNPLLTLLRGMESGIAISDAERIAGKVKELNNDISTLQEIQSLATNIEGALKKTVGHTYGPSVSIESALPDSMERLLQRLNLLVGDDSGSGHRGELQEQSLGSANLIYLSLKLLEYELKLSTDRVAHFFLIEEPEAHIHTHIQKTLFANLPAKSTQVIVSTHSTHVSSASRVASVNVLAKKGNHAEVYQPANGLSEEEIRSLERYLDAVRSTVLFAKGVVLVEGDAEQIMIPAMLRAIFGVSQDELGFSVISADAAFFEHLAALFSEERVKRPCAIVTDLDRAIIELPVDPGNDTDEQKHARAGEKDGKARKVALDKFAHDNAWIQVFYASHTFEPDFIQTGNAPEVVRVLDSIYKNAQSKTNSASLLESDDKRTSGLEILRLASKVGKGWFALALAERLDVQTYFPDYILRAIAFACYPHVNDATLKRIGQFRQNAQGDDGPLVQAFAGIADLQSLSSADFMAAFRDGAPNDELSLFAQYIEEFRQ
jgi:predicted ATP-dependent endonuclease of OLD family